MRDKFAPVKIPARHSTERKGQTIVPNTTLRWSLSLHIVPNDLAAFHHKGDSFELCNVLQRIT
jgi:hypothetical protein